MVSVRRCERAKMRTCEGAKVRTYRGANVRRRERANERGEMHKTSEAVAGGAGGIFAPEPQNPKQGPCAVSTRRGLIKSRTVSVSRLASTLPVLLLAPR